MTQGTQSAGQKPPTPLLPLPTSYQICQRRPKAFPWWWVSQASVGPFGCWGGGPFQG